MNEDNLSEDEWQKLASIRHSVRGTRKEDVLEAFPGKTRATVSPSEIAEKVDMSLSNVSRELQKLVSMDLVNDLASDKPNYKPYAITNRGLQIREMLNETTQQEES